MIPEVVKADVGYQKQIIEKLYEDIFSQKDKINRLLDDIVSRRSPKVTLKLPKGYDHGTFDKNDGISVMYDGTEIKGVIIYGNYKKPELRIGEKGTIHVYGKGRTGLESKGLAVRLIHMDFNVSEPGTTYAKPIKRDDLGLFFSGSWKTKSTIMYARETKKRGATTVPITSHPERIKRGYCDYWIKISGKEDLGKIRDCYVKELERIEKLRGRRITQMDSLGTIYEFYIAAFKDILVHLLSNRLGIEEEKMKERHPNIE